MLPPPDDLHARYTQQAQWTTAIRRYLLGRAGLTPGAQVLEVGCGTGAVLAALAGDVNAAAGPDHPPPKDIPLRAFGLDIDRRALRLARRSTPGAFLSQADALHLPFPGEAFDLVLCHFLLLWIPQPEQALAEMARVTCPGGWVMAFAEPDYGGRVDYPPPLDELGRLQTTALAKQGADPTTGRKLAAFFSGAGLRQVETGVLGGQWRDAPVPAAIESEWQTLLADLRSLPGHPLTADHRRLEALRRANENAWRAGRRVLFVPTFYAAGKK